MHPLVAICRRCVEVRPDPSSVLFESNPPRHLWVHVSRRCQALQFHHFGALLSLVRVWSFLLVPSSASSVAGKHDREAG